MATLVHKSKALAEFKRPIFWSVDLPSTADYVRLIAAMVAGLALVIGLVTVLMNLLPGEWLRVIAALMGMSGLIYFALATDSEDGASFLINIVAGAAVIGLAYAAVDGPLIALAGAMGINVLWVVKEFWSRPARVLNTWILMAWASFNLGGMLTLTLA